LYRLKDLIKTEYYILISRESGGLVFQPTNSLYLRVPSEIRKALENFGIDFKKHKKDINVRCDLVRNAEGIVSLVYSFSTFERTHAPSGEEVKK
jgi:hypothetical protein